MRYFEAPHIPQAPPVVVVLENPQLGVLSTSIPRPGKGSCMGRPRQDHLRDVEERHQPRDNREGEWTKLELIKMDARFCAAAARAHPELTEPRVVSVGSGAAAAPGVSLDWH